MESEKVKQQKKKRERGPPHTALDALTGLSAGERLQTCDVCNLRKEGDRVKNEKKRKL